MDKVKKLSVNKIENNIDYKKNDIESRIFESFGSLIGKTFKKGDKIPLNYKTPDGKIVNYKFDTITNKILIDEKIFTIKSLEGTIVDRIEFTDKKLIIYGKIGIVDGKMEATYVKTIKAIDKIYSYINKNK